MTLVEPRLRRRVEPDVRAPPLGVTSQRGHAEPEPCAGEESRVFMRPFADAQSDNMRKPAEIGVVTSSIVVCWVKLNFYRDKKEEKV